MESDRRTANIDRDALSLIFERVSFSILGIPSVIANFISYMKRYLGEARMTSTRRNVNSAVLLMA